MSRATTLSTAQRETHYLTQTGRADLTPAQRRRSRHKANDLVRPTARTGRLRRRLDVKADREVATNSKQLVAWIRGRVHNSRHAPKASSKRQLAKQRRS